MYTGPADRAGDGLYDGVSDTRFGDTRLYPPGGQHDTADECVFGWKYGMAAGGIGSALADLLSGYAHWAPFTLIIKGGMGLLIGLIADFTGKQEKFFTLRNMAGGVIGIIWMVFGYFIGGGILKSSFAVAATSIPENLVQGAAGMAIFLVVGTAFYKAKIYRFVSEK